MVDVTVIATAAITAAAALGGATLQTWVSRQSLKAEDRRADIDRAIQRRHERQETYEKILDSLTDWSWSAVSPSADYDVVEDFSKPFNLAAMRIRLYGSPATIAAVDAIQTGFALLNDAGDDSAVHVATTAIWDGIDRLVIAAREDVGPRESDGLRDVSFRPGAGVPA
jgi:hypothetical protein